MLNDTVISGLLNLFALIGAKNGVDTDKSIQLISDYLGRHFGLRNKEQYIDLYRDLRDLYELDPTIEKDSIVEGICKNLKGQIEAGELKVMLLRLMEFGHIEPENFLPKGPVYQMMARQFEVSDGMYDDFCDFVEDRETSHVKRQRYDGYDGYIKTLWVGELNRMVFTYVGTDNVSLNDVRVLPGVFQTWHESGVLKNHKGSPLYYSTIRLPYTQSDTADSNVTYCGRDVEFRFPNHDRKTRRQQPLSPNGLHNFSFTLRSGELVAIMGGSGAGKTTLLTLLNGTLHPQSGSLTINGHDISEPEVRSLIGFVPQDDLLIEELTVYQNLYYTARLCFDGMDEQELDRRVMQVLADLGLDQAKDLKVGSAVNKFISGGQRKRLNIALELIREPSVLFLDEPTSGLSSADTEHVVGLLKAQTYKGRLVVMNIHQPSSDVYKLFDRLWLLDRGGYPVFDGNPIDAITYFKTAVNFADADTSTCPTCGNLNPELVLNIIDAKSLDSSGRMTSNRKMSPEQWHDLYISQQRQEMPAVEQSAVPASHQKKPGRMRQLLIFLERTLKAKLTNMQYVAITLLEAPLLAGICAMLTRYAPSTGYTLMDNKNLVSYIFMAVIVAIFLGMSGSAEEIIKDRALLKREKFLHLSYGSYIWSKIIFAAGVTLLQTFLFIIVGNTIMGMESPLTSLSTPLFFTFWLVLFAVAMLSSLIGLLLSQRLNSVVSIYISIPILLIPQILLCGVVVDFSDLNPDSKTGNVPVIGNVIPSRWAFEALAVEQFQSNKYEQPYYQYDRANYQMLYYRDVYLYELESQLETYRHEQQEGKTSDVDRMAIIRTSLPQLTDYMNQPAYDGDWSYASLNSHFAQLRKTLSSAQASRAVFEKDAVINQQLRSLRPAAKEQGVRAIDLLNDVKRRNHNLRLQDFVTGSDSRESFVIVDHQIVPRMGAIYLDPLTSCGNAPFYSAYKRIGSQTVSTLTFNLFVMLLMAVLITSLLVTNLWNKE